MKQKASRLSKIALLCILCLVATSLCALLPLAPAFAPANATSILVAPPSAYDYPATLYDVPAGSGREYFVSSLGDDANDGSFDHPWKTLDKISSTTFLAGDTIRLNRGDIFTGTLILNGRGTAINPITLTHYGTGDRPIILSPDDKSFCLTIPDTAEGFRIIGIEFANGAEGIRITAGKTIPNAYYYIADCYVRDIRRNDNAMLPAPGIGINIMGSVLPYTTANPLTLSDTARDVTVKNCIFTGNDADFSSFGGAYTTNILIDGCTFTRTKYNSVYHCSATNFDITNCVWFDCCVGYFKFGLTCIISGALTGTAGTNAVFNNEFGFTRDSGGNDGCAFDFEWDTDGIIFSNNFAHNGFGEAILMMKEATCKDIEIANNIFYKNVVGSALHGAELALYGKGSGTVHDNIFESVSGVERIHYVRRRGIKTLFSQLAGNTSGLKIKNNSDRNLSSLLSPTPTGTFDPTANTVSFTAPAGAILRYTTDGSIPTENSPIYTGPVTVAKTTVVHCKNFSSALPSITASVFAAKDGRVAPLDPLPPIPTRSPAFPWFAFVFIGLVAVAFTTCAFINKKRRSVK